MAEYIDFLDMIDGGGPGRMGGKFKGGGLLSLLANAVATPYGSEDEQRRRARMKAYGLLDMVSPPAAVVPVTTTTTTTPPRTVRTGPAPSYATMDMGEAGRGANLGYPLQNIPAAYEYGGNRPVMPAPLQDIPPAYQYGGNRPMMEPQVAPATRTGVPTLDDFIGMQKQMEQQYGFQPMTADDYMSAYQRFLNKLGY